MVATLIPYGKLANGKYGIAIEDGTQRPLAAAIEILASLPSVGSADNFVGRVVFDETTQTVYTFRDEPAPQWRALDGAPVTVASGSPPTSPTPPTGDLFFSTTNSVLYIYTGVVWLAVGGQFAASVVANTYTGDGITDTFATGVTGPIPVGLINAYLDGVRQTPTADYISLGNNVKFLTPPANGTIVFVSTLASGAINQNAETTVQSYVADGATSIFDIGAAGLSASGVFVFKNGLIQTLSTHYTLSSQNTTITSLTRVGTTATAVTAQNHGRGIGSTVTIAGASPAGWNGTYVLTAVPAPNSFQFTVSNSLTTPATASPLIFFQPPTQNDKVTFLSLPGNGDLIEIRTLRHAVTGPSIGEANTATNVGAGVQVFKEKVGVDLQFKSFVNGPNMSITDLGNEVRFAVTSLNTFENRVGINTSTYVVGSNDSYVGVINTSVPVVIDITTIFTAGRRIMIGDESGGAATNSITITTGGTVAINGSFSGYVINTNYGHVTLVASPGGWFIRGAN